MKNTHSIEVKCESIIPFHAELTDYLQKLISSPTNENDYHDPVPHKEAIAQAIKSKMLFVKLDFADSIKKVRPKLLMSVKKVFKKDLVGTIKVGKNEITFILL